MEVLYLGNVSGKFVAQPSQMELIIPKLREKHYVKFGSHKKNILVRTIHFLILIIHNRRRIDFIFLDVYSSRYFYGIFLASQLAKIIRKPYICVLRGGNLPSRIKRNPFLSDLIFVNALKLVAPSEYLKLEFEKYGYETTVIYNSVEHDIFITSRFRQKVKPRMLYVRSLLKDYNPLMALKILRELVKYYPDAFLCMIGVSDHKILHEVNDFIALNGLQNNFLYKGCLTKDEWFKLSQDYDIYLSTTNIDNAPVSMLEAYNLGMLVASTNVGGIPFIAEHNKTALLFDPGDFLSASKIIYEVLQDQNKARCICKEGYNYGKKFRLSNVINDWFRLLDNIKAEIK